MLGVEIEGVIEPGAIDRRRPSRVLGRAEDDDGGGWPQFLGGGLVHDAPACPGSLADRNQDRRVISYAESLAIQYLPDFFRGNGAFAHDSPTVLSAQIHNGGGNITRRGAAVNDDANAAIELHAHLFGGRTLRRAAEVCRRCSNWNAC